MNVLTQRTEECAKQLLAERYQPETVDAIHDCLGRAEGIAGLLTDVSALNNDGVCYTNPKHIEHTAKAVQMEVRDAMILFNDFYQACRREA